MPAGMSTIDTEEALGMTELEGAGAAAGAGSGPGDLQALLARFERPGPHPEEARWLLELRAQLAASPEDPEALRALETRRFAQVCRWLGVAPDEGRRRFLASVEGLAAAPRGLASEGGSEGGSESVLEGASESALEDAAANAGPVEAQPDSAPGEEPSAALEEETVVAPTASRWRGILVGLLVAAAVVAVVWLLPAGELIGAALSRVQTLGAWGPPILAAFYVVACVLFLPGSVITLAAGYLFGLVTGTWVVVVGSVAGASVAFLIGRTLLRRRVEAWVEGRPRFAAIDRVVGDDGLKIVLLTRLSPVLPFNLLNFAFGITRVRFRDYLLGSVVGMFPGTVLYVYLGTAAKNLTDVLRGKVAGGPAQTALLAIGLVATLVVTVLITRTASRALAEATDD